MNVRPFLVALLLPVAFTATTLALVGWNRSAGRGPVVLSEQEIYVGYRSDDNTTARIGLAWQQPSRRPPIAAGGIREERIEPELREGCAALELRETAPADDLLPGIGRGGPGIAGGGPGFGGAVSGPRSRLVVVDVDADALTLERRYPDGRTHIIAAAQVNVPRGQSFADGFVVSLEPQQIHVPRDMAASLPLAGEYGDLVGGGGFEIELWYGVRYEPWISAVRRK